MSKVIIVGHPSANIQGVEAIFRKAGMETANSSQQNELKAQEITELLCQIENIAINSYKKIEQIEVGEVWYGLVLDLMLANYKKKLWGWAESNAIYLLDFWSKQDPNGLFVLTYSKPESIYTQFSLEDQVFDSSESIELVNEWIEYNNVILDFYKKNKDKCLLVSSDQITGNSLEVLSSIEKYIDNKVLSKNIPNNIKNKISIRRQKKKIQKEISQEYIGGFKSEREIVDLNNNKELLDGNNVALFIINSLVNQYPELHLLYEELQNVSDISYGGKVTNLDPKNTLNIWNSFVSNKIFMSNKEKYFIDELESYKNKENVLIEEINSVRNESNKLIVENNKIINDLQVKVRDINKNYHILEDKAKWRAQKIEELSKTIEEQHKEIINQKSEVNKYRGEKSKISLQQENKLLMSQLDQLRLELGKFYILSEKPEDSTRKSLHGAAERVKQDLAYQLGSTVISHSRSLNGLISMPNAIYSKVKVSKKREELPALEDYVDIYEAEKVKKHLSYRLGSLIVNAGENPIKILNLPINITKEILSFRKDKK